MIVAEGRLLGQWHDELTRGAPGRGLPPLAPNVEVLVIDERVRSPGRYARSTPHSATARAWCSSRTGCLTGIPPTCR